MLQTICLPKFNYKLVSLTIGVSYFKRELKLTLYLVWVYLREAYLKEKGSLDEESFKVATLKLKLYAYSWYTPC